MNNSKGFTLAEVMIVLTIIGVLTGILIPAAMHSMPNEDVMKFKKAHDTFYKVITELVNSDKYYKDGDLGVKYDGTVFKGSSFYSGDELESHEKYFCNAFSDVIPTKSTNCTKDSFSGCGSIDIAYAACATVNNYKDDGGVFVFEGKVVTDEAIQDSKALLDNLCKSLAPGRGNQIISEDNIAYFETRPAVLLGQTYLHVGQEKRADTLMHDINGFPVVYKVFCIDIDGVPNNATASNCVNECPFGYGIRSDGKILPGARAEVWLKKSLQEKD